MATDLRTVADRRIRDAQASGIGMRGPLSKSLGRSSSQKTAVPKGSGLTRRERRVKEILLKELNTINGSTKTWAAYQERRHLMDTLDVAFIDREIETMRGQLRRPPIAQSVMGVVWLVLLSFHVVDIDSRGWSGSDTLNLLVVALGLGSVVAGVVHIRRATRRRLWIYQALRELSDAEDEGVHLDESVRAADLLIDRIIDAEEAGATAPLHRVRTI